MNLLKKHRILPISIIAVVLIAAVVILTLFQTGVLGAKTYGLDTTPPTTVAPVFKKGLKVPGFKSSETTTPLANGKIATRVANLSQNGNNGQKNCTVTYQTVYESAYLAGRGDTYLTKDFLYSQSEQLSQTQVKDVKLIPVKTTNGATIMFESGRYSFTNTVPTSNDPTATKSTAKLDIRFAARSIDKVYPNGITPAKGQPTKGQFGTDLRKGVPLLLIQYQCVNTSTSAATWQQVLNNAVVDLS